MVAAIIVAAVLVVTGHGSSRPALAASTVESQIVEREVNTLLDGISQSGNTLGQSTAPMDSAKKG